ncbi:MAG: hypothetical protein JNL58_27275 [Planctomyces sp.]|nr:hypothetical protein [Planctomyces sp.]
MTLGFVVCMLALSGPGLNEDMFVDVGPNHPARSRLDGTLDSPAGPGADLLYRGLMNQSVKLGALLRREREFGVAGQGLRTEVTLPHAVRLMLVLKETEECLDHAIRALNAENLDAMGWLVATRAVQGIAQEVPLRKQLAPMPPGAELLIEAIQSKLRDCLLKSLERGLSLREMTFVRSQSQTSTQHGESSDPSLLERREAVRQYIIASVQLLHDTETAFAAAVSQSSGLNAFDDWVLENGIHPPRPGKAVFSGSIPLELSLSDELSLTPWSFRLAERLGIGRIESSIKAINVESSPETPPITLVPTIVLDQTFVLNKSGERWPVSTIRLSGRAIDCLTLGDEKALREAVGALLPVEKRPDAATMPLAELSKLAEAKTLQQYHATAAVGNLAQTKEAAQVVRTAFPDLTFNRECFWLLREQILPPGGAAIAEETSTSTRFGTDAWRLERGLMAKFVDGPPVFEEADFAVALIHQFIERSWKELELEIHKGLASGTIASESLNRVSIAQGQLETAKVWGIPACDLHQNIAVEAAVKHLTTIRRQRESEMRLTIPAYVPPHRRFHRFQANEKTQVVVIPRRISELLALWAKVESDLQSAADPDDIAVWSVAGPSLIESERLFNQLFGDEGLSSLTAKHSFSSPWISGLCCPVEVSTVSQNRHAKVAADRQDDEAERVFSNDAATLLECFDLAEQLRLMVHEIDSLMQMKALVTDDESWNAFVQKHGDRQTADPEGLGVKAPPVRPTLAFPTELEKRVTDLSRNAVMLAGVLEGLNLEQSPKSNGDLETHEKLERVRAALGNARNLLISRTRELQESLASGKKLAITTDYEPCLSRDDFSFLFEKSGGNSERVMFLESCRRIAATARSMPVTNGDNVESALAMWLIETTRLTEAKVEKPIAMKIAWEAVAIEGLHSDKAAEFQQSLFEHASIGFREISDAERRSLSKRVRGWYIEE